MAIALGNALGQQPVFRTGVHHVELDVVVTDKNDKPVTTLTQADFAISENKKPQTVADFQFVSIPPVRRVIPSVTAAKPVIDVVSNAHAPLARQWVLLVDDLHIFEQRIVETKRVLQNFLERLPPSDQVAVVFTGRSDLSLDFTSDLGSLARVLTRVRAAVGMAMDTPAVMLADDHTERHQIFKANCVERANNARSSLDVVRNITGALVRSSFPRRALVYVGQGFDFSLQTVGAQRGDDETMTSCPYEDLNVRELRGALQDQFQRARRAGVPVYTIDPRGTLTPEDATKHGVADDGAMRAEMEFLQVVAENTGGRAFVNRPSMAAAVDELFEDNGSFYLLGYYPDPLVRDGAFHDVKVTIPGHPEYRVRSKAGYDAPRASATTATETKSSLNDVLGAALPTGGLTLRAFAAPVAPGGKGMKTAVTLEVVYTPPFDGSKIDDELQFGIVALDLDGKIKATSRRAFHFTATPRSKDDVVYTINDVIELPSQPLTLRVAVASQALAKAGSIHLPVEAVNAGKDEIQISTVVLGFAGAKREAAARADAFAGLLPFQPTTARVFARTDTLQIYAPLFWKSKDTAATVTLTFRGERADTTREERVPSTAGPDGHRHGALNITAPLRELAPGRYVLEVEAKLSNGQANTRAVAFEIK